MNLEGSFDGVMDMLDKFYLVGLFILDTLGKKFLSTAFDAYRSVNEHILDRLGDLIHIL